MDKFIDLPARFFLDHKERDLKTPKAWSWGKHYVTVKADDPALPELLSDAEYYAGKGGPSEISAGLRASAKATVKAIKDAEA